MTFSPERVRELDQAASAGPWKAGRSDMTSYDMNDGAPFKNVYESRDGGGPVARGLGDDCHANATFIAYAREALPEASREVERLREELEQGVEIIMQLLDLDCRERRRGEPCSTSAIHMDAEKYLRAHLSKARPR